MKLETCPTDENSFKLMHSHAPSYFNRGDVEGGPVGPHQDTKVQDIPGGEETPCGGPNHTV